MVLKKVYFGTFVQNTIPGAVDKARPSRRVAEPLIGRSLHGKINY
jgi:hypothetical protein